MLLSQIKPEGTLVREDYRIVLREQGPYLVVILPFEFGNPGCDFEHENVAARHAKILEYKHSNDHRKWWTQKAGVQLVFIVAKDQIDLDESECWYSYPKVKIAGVECTFSCSGIGGSGPWTDILDVGHCGVNSPVAFLKHVASIAVSPEEAKRNGFDFPICRTDAKDRAKWIELAAKQIDRPKFQAGDVIVPRAGLSWGGMSGPFKWDSSKGKVHLAHADDGQLARISFEHIDWKKTAEENEWLVPELPVEFNKIGELQPSRAEQADAFYAANKDKIIVTCGWCRGNDNDDVPEGYTGVSARVDGDRGNGPESYWLIPQDEYGVPGIIGTDGRVIDPEKDQPWAGPRSRHRKAVAV